MTKISVAVACVLAASAALAQTVQRGDTTVSNTGKATQTVAQSSTAAPVQTAQAPAGGTAAGAGLGTTLVVVGAAVAAIAIASDSGSTVTH